MTEQSIDQSNAVVIQNKQSTQVSGLMSIISDAAKDPNYDVGKLKELINLKNDMENREAKLSYMRDYSSMKGRLPKIIKNKKNTHTKSDYADLSQINDAVDPVLSEFGFATTQKVIAQNDSTVTIRAEILHRDGHSDFMDMTFPIDDKGSGGNVNKTVIQGMSSTISYLKRVAKCTMLDIAAGEDIDGNDPNTSDVITIEQAADLDTRLRALGGPDAVNRFLVWAKIEQITELLLKKYPAAIKALSHQEDEAKTKKNVTK